MSEVRHYWRRSSRQWEGSLIHPRPQDGEGDVGEGPGQTAVQLQGQQRSECQDHHQVHGGCSEAEEHFSQDSRFVPFDLYSFTFIIVIYF